MEEATGVFGWQQRTPSSEDAYPVKDNLKLMASLTLLDGWRLYWRNLGLPTVYNALGQDSSTELIENALDRVTNKLR